VAFIGTHADRETVEGLRWGVEPICRVLSEHGVPIVPSTYDDAVKVARQISEADLREERLMVTIARVHHDNYGERFRALVLARSLVSSTVTRERSRESSDAMLRPEAASSSTGRRSRSGKRRQRPGVPSGRSSSSTRG